MSIKDDWYSRNAPEFYIGNYEDLSDGGKKIECMGCHKWDFIKNLTSEDGVTFYHPMCEILD